MSNLIVDGYGTYGSGASTWGYPSGSNATAFAMLSGAYAETPAEFKGETIHQTVAALTAGIPWDVTNTDYWLRGWQTSTGGHVGWGARRVLPGDTALTRYSLHMGLASLPTTNKTTGILVWRDSSNTDIATLWVDTTGALRFSTAADVITNGPVVVAEKDHHIECEIDTGAGTFKCYVDGMIVLNATGVSFSGTPAQFCISGGHNPDSGLCYITGLIVRDDQGDYNNTFPIGDRRVATLVVNSDDPAHQGWTPQYLHRFGVGILDLTPASAAVRTGTTTHTDLGSDDFTLEGQIRFQSLPTAATKAALFAKWDSTANTRSYELYLGGPSLDNGLLTFRTSTDGTDGTTVNKVQWEWTPETGRWYHVAMCRDGGDLKLFIDGVLQGVPVADGDTYFAGAARTCLGAETNANAVLANTLFDGWMDEFRFTAALSRYSANFTPPTEGFPRGVDDPEWGAVVWLSSFDNAVVADDGPLALALVALGSAAAITPNDGAFAYQTMNKIVPNDDTFLEAALISATSLFTMSALPANTETTTVGVNSGASPAVYTFKTVLADAYDVLIGADVAATAANLVAAINAADGEGTTYGTGTAANASVSAVQLPSNQVEVTALTPGTIGNSIATSATTADGSWTSTVLAGGQDIPAYSQFGFSRMPGNTTIVDSITLVGRQWKTDTGLGTTELSFVGAEGGVATGAENALGTVPNLTFDTIEEDPDTSAGLTPTSILLGKVRVDRTG